MKIVLLCVLRPRTGESLNLDYREAKVTMEESKTQSGLGKTEQDSQVTVAAFQEAQARYAEAAGKFLMVKPTSPNYESALYQAGACYLLAQELWTSVRLPFSPKESQAQGADLTQKCLDCFARYETLIAQHPNVPEEDQNRRLRLAGAILLARSKLYLGMHEWKQAQQAEAAKLDAAIVERYETRFADLQRFLKDCYDHKMPVPESLKPVFNSPEGSAKAQAR